VSEFKTVAQSDGWRIMKESDSTLEQELVEAVVEAETVSVRSQLSRLKLGPRGPKHDQDVTPLVRLACAETARESAQARRRQSVLATARCHGSTGSHLPGWLRPSGYSPQAGPGLLILRVQRPGVSCAPFRCLQSESLWRMRALQAHVAASRAALSDVHFAAAVQSAALQVNYPPRAYVFEIYDLRR
jgi:hypothetical protein